LLSKITIEFDFVGHVNVGFVDFGFQMLETLVIQTVVELVGQLDSSSA